MEETQIEEWKDSENTEGNYEMIWKIWNKIVER